MFKRIKTPHGNNGQHFFNLLCLFVGSAFLSITFGDNVSDGASLLGGGLLIGSVGMIGGLILTIIIRWAFGLIQTGRILQYACFWGATWAGVVAAQALFAGFSAAYPALLSLAVFVFAFGVATAIKEVPWRGRTWLPKRKALKDKVN